MDGRPAPCTPVAALSWEPASALPPARPAPRPARSHTTRAIEGGCRSSGEPSREPQEQRAASVLELRDLARDAALEFSRRLVIEVDPGEDEFQARRQIEL